MKLDRIKIITLLAERRMSKKELAYISGLSRETISNICNKDGENCSLNTAKKISNALNVALVEIAIPLEQYN